MRSKASELAGSRVIATLKEIFEYLDRYTRQAHHSKQMGLSSQKDKVDIELQRFGGVYPAEFPEELFQVLLTKNQRHTPSSLLKRLILQLHTIKVINGHSSLHLPYITTCRNISKDTTTN